MNDKHTYLFQYHRGRRRKAQLFSERGKQQENEKLAATDCE